MIEAVRFRNYRALRKVDIRLGPLTVLVGPNGCGKSSVLEGLAQKGEISRKDRAVNTKKSAVLVQLAGSEGAWTYRKWTAEAQVDTTWSGHVDVHSWELAQLRVPSRASSSTKLSRTGDNCAQVLASMPTRRRAQLSEVFCALVPTFSDVGAVPARKPGELRLAFYDRWSDTELTPEQVSDGSLLALALVTLAHQPERPDLVCIEEPENGLHPYLVRKILEIIVGLTQGDDPLQIVLTTHSPLVLDCVPAESVRFMRRDRDGHVRVQAAPTGTDDWSTYLDTFDDRLGDAWLTGGLGGVNGV